MPITTQCQLLGLSRSSVYYRAREISGSDLTLMRRLDELHLEHPFLGSRKLARLLKDEGHAIGRRHVTTLMRRMGVEVIYRKPRTSLPDHAHKIYPYLLSRVVIERPNQVWAADITYLPMAKGFVYLVAILDLYSRKVVGWRTNNTLTSDFCVEALQEALRRFGRPEVFNTDSKNARASCRTRTAPPFTVSGRSRSGTARRPGQPDSKHRSTVSRVFPWIRRPSGSLLRRGFASPMRVTREGPDVLSRYCPVQAFGLGQALIIIIELGDQPWSSLQTKRTPSLVASIPTKICMLPQSSMRRIMSWAPIASPPHGKATDRCSSGCNRSEFSGKSVSSPLGPMARGCCIYRPLASKCWR
jgi:transposase-like protein